MARCTARRTGIGGGLPDEEEESEVREESEDELECALPDERELEEEE